MHMRSTPVSAHAYVSPSVQRTQFSPIASEEELLYDSGAEWAARQCGAMTQPPPYEEVTELQPLAAWDARREAERAGMGAYAQQPSFAYAPGQYSGEPLHDRAAARGGGPLDAHQPSNGDRRAHQEIPPDQLCRTAPEASVNAHRASGGDGRPVRTVPRVEEEQYLNLPSAAPQETQVKVLNVPLATTGAVACDERRVNAAGNERGRAKAPGQREVLTRPGFPGSAEEMSRVTGQPVPAAYDDVRRNPFIERDVRPKTGASRNAARGRGRARQSATTAPDTPPRLATQRRNPRTLRLAETGTGEELVPIRSVEAAPDARSMVVSLTQIGRAHV